MKLHLNSSEYIDTEKGIDLSIAITTDKDNVSAWYCSPVSIDPVMTDQFIGDVNQGGVVNFKNITINPHGNGTHTECVGHISKEPYTINKCLKSFHFKARLISIQPEKKWNAAFESMDEIIQKKEIEEKTKDWKDEKVLIVRTLENTEEKKKKQYSGTNPTYFSKAAIETINELGVEHLMVDLPSVDREEDNGELIGHHTFWNYPENVQVHKTISELLFIPNTVEDGVYFVQIQIMPIENDASPSKIMLHRIQNT